MNTQNFEHFDNASFKKFTNPSLIEKDLQTLVGILEGIKSDGEITAEEHSLLKRWMNDGREYENRQPYKEVMKFLRLALEDNVLTDEEIKNISWYCNQYINKTGYYSALSSGIQKLTGIVHGIVIDKKVNLKELEYLDAWMEENEHLKNAYPYDELYNLVTSIIQDRYVSEEEQYAFYAFCKSLIGHSSDTTNDLLLHSLSAGYYQIDPSIVIPEQQFCITGVSRRYKRQEIAEKIELFGGYVTNSVSGKLNYLVVCDEKSNCWAFTCYGKKVEDAIKHRKKGANLIIIHENDLYDHFESIR
jgi:hypothetical protein